MKKLSELYPGVSEDVLIKGIKINSKECEEGDLFVCTKGVTADRHDFIPDAVKHGASAVIVSRDVGNVGVPVIKVPDTNRELPYLCQKFYDYPTIMQALIGSDVCGYIGTNGRSCAQFTGDNPNTTPDAHLLYSYFKEFLDCGCKYVAMEASSEAFFRGRLQSIQFDVSVYTNVTSEHLNIHGTFENYLQCKEMLFRQTKKDGTCVLNMDDPYYEQIKAVCNGNVVTYGSGEDATLQIVDYKVYPTHTLIHFKYRGEIVEVDSPLLGDFNVYNLAAGLLAALSVGVPLEQALSRIPNIKISGRLDLLNTNTPYYVMVDYAHTPNGITKLLNFVHTLDINRSIVVIGQAGERDYLKRPQVGEVVVKNATYAIFTYEDPRSEDPKAICDDIVKTVKDTYQNYEIVIDRREAIQKAIDMAQEKDMVLILGKGNETYQKLKDETIYFNDEEEAYQAVANRKMREGVMN